MTLPASTILAAAAPVFLLLLLGYGLRRLGVLTQEADKSLMKLFINVLYPCLFLHFVVGNEAVMTAKNLLLPPTVGFVTVTLGYFVGWWMARLIRLRKGGGLRTFAFCNGVYNYGYIPIPLIAALFGDRATAGILLVHNFGVELALWTVGIVLVGGKLDRSVWKRLINAPIIALLTALLINATGADAHVPGWLDRFVEMLAMCAIPIGILLAGGAIADLARNNTLLSDFRVPVAAVATRLMVLPAIFILLAWVLPWGSEELRRVMVVQAAMPAGIFPIVLSRHYGGEVSVAIKVVLATTLVCVVTMPLWILVGSRLVLGG